MGTHRICLVLLLSVLSSRSCRPCCYVCCLNIAICKGRVFVLVTDNLLKWQIVHKGYDAAKIKHHKSQVISMIEDVEDLCMVRVWLDFVDFGKC